MRAHGFWTVVVCAVLISCGGSGGMGAAGGSGGSGAGGGSGGSGAVGGSGGMGAAGGSGGMGALGGGSGAAGAITVRVANTFVRKGMTSGATIDIYDDMYDTGPQPSVSGKPVIAGLAYGSMSDYVKPRFTDLHGTAVRLTALPAGASPNDTADGQEFWGTADDGSHPQFTLLVVAESPGDGTPLSGLSVHTYAEKGEDDLGADMGPLAPPPPAGQGEYLVATNPLDDGLFTPPVGDYFFFVDDSCTPPLNGDPFVPGVPLIFGDGQSSTFALFGASPGSHSLSVVAWLTATTPTCAQLLGATRQGTTAVTVAAGQQIIAWVYGTSLSDLHLLVGPIAP